MRKLAMNVTVDDVTYRAGSVPPAEVAERITHPRAWTADDAEPEPEVIAPTEPEPVTEAVEEVEPEEEAETTEADDAEPEPAAEKPAPKRRARKSTN